MCVRACMYLAVWLCVCESERVMSVCVCEGDGGRRTVVIAVLALFMCECVKHKKSVAARALGSLL